MLPLSILKKTDNSMVYELPPGKPSSTEKYTMDNDCRKWVIQFPYKGNTCWYYTMNFLRKRIGKNSPEELLKERKIEKLCSLRRKKRTEHEKSLPAITDQLSTEFGLKVLGGIDLEKAKIYIENKVIMEPKFNTKEALEGAPSLFPFIEEFFYEGKQKNMHDFLMNKKFAIRNEIDEEFLTHFHTNKEELLESEMTISNGYQKKVEWDKLQLTQKSWMLDFFARHVSAKAYGLQKSSWAPKKGIDGLITELKNSGPLFVSGFLGKITYVDAPFKMKEKLAHRDIYAWNPGAKRHSMTNIGHSVLLVGATKVENKGFIYFIDSIDPSDPQDPSKQKMYMMSFTSFVQHLCDLHGRPKQDSHVGYAYYGNFKI